MKTLILNLHYGAKASYYNDWEDAFKQSNLFDADILNIMPSRTAKTLAKTVASYDLIVLLHACTADSLVYLEPIASVLQARRGRLLAFIGNEYNMTHNPLSARIVFLQSIGVDWIATQLCEEAGQWLYGDVAHVISLPHACNTDVFSSSIPLSQRAIDIGTRTFRYPGYLGDDVRNQLIDRIKSYSTQYNIDVRTDLRFHRSEWARFLSSCKATVGTEAGTWYLDRDDSLVTLIAKHLQQQSNRLTLSSQSTWLRRIVNRLPFGFKTKLKQFLAKTPLQFDVQALENANYEDLYERFFKDRARSPVYTKCISSRHFDAAGTMSAQILVEGRYNDILTAGDHYIAVKEDFSNLDSALEQLSDINACQVMIQRTHELMMSKHTYNNRLSALYDAIADHK